MNYRMLFLGTLLLLTCSKWVLAKPSKIEQWRTQNGVSVIFYQAMEIPILDVNLAFAAGSAYDRDQYGLSALTAQMIHQGSAGQSVDKVSGTLDATGSQLAIQNNRDMVVFSLRTLTQAPLLNTATQLLNQIVTKPDFPDSAFQTQKNQLLMAVKQVEESPDDVAGVSFFNSLYHEHPYAHPVDGTTETVAALQKKQLLAFYRQYYVAANATLVLVGAVDSQSAHQLAEKLTQGLDKGTPAATIAKATPLNHAKQIAIPFPSSQTVVRLGQLGIDHNNPNYFPLMVGNYILGGGSLVSRLAIEVREKRGLSYGVDSAFLPMPGEGPFIISLSTKNKEANNALQVTQETLDHFVQHGPSQEELEAAKKYLTGSFPISLSSNRDIATLLLRMHFYHLPSNYLETYVDRVNAVTREQIKQAFKEQIHPDKLLLVTVGQL